MSDEQFMTISPLRNTMYRYLIGAFLLLACYTQAFAQREEGATISGKVLDAETNEPLISAAVTIRNQFTGVVSNSLGEFDFHFDKKFKDDNLVISMLGYESFEIPIYQIDFSKPLIIRLNNVIKLLDEVIIKDSLTGGDIVTIAFNKITFNYPMKPFLMNAFYRDLRKVDDRYISLLETSVEIFDNDYAMPRNQNKLREKVGLVEIRKSLGFSHKKAKFFNQDNLLENLLLSNTVRYRNLNRGQKFMSDLKRHNNLAMYNNKRAYVITYDKDFYLKMYIDFDTYAILRVEYEFSGNGEFGSPNKKRNKSINSKYRKVNQTIDFKEYNGKMYVKYMTMYTQNIWYDEKSSEPKTRTELFQELLVNAVEPNTKKRIKPTKRMKKYGLQYQDQPYNRTFWENYNSIKETPLDKQIVKDLEKEATLDEQFENN